MEDKPPAELQKLIEAACTRTLTASTDSEMVAILLRSAADAIRDLAEITRWYNDRHAKRDPEYTAAIGPDQFMNGRGVDLKSITGELIPRILELLPRVQSSHHDRIREAVGHVERIADDIRHSLDQWHRFAKLSKKYLPAPANLDADFDRKLILSVSDAVKRLPDNVGDQIHEGVDIVALNAAADTTFAEAVRRRNDHADELASDYRDAIRSAPTKPDKPRAEAIADTLAKIDIATGNSVGKLDQALRLLSGLIRAGAFTAPELAGWLYSLSASPTFDSAICLLHEHGHFTTPPPQAGTGDHFRWLNAGRDRLLELARADAGQGKTGKRGDPKLPPVTDYDLRISQYIKSPGMRATLTPTRDEGWPEDYDAEDVEKVKASLMPAPCRQWIAENHQEDANTGTLSKKLKPIRERHLRGGEDHV